MVMFLGMLSVLPIIHLPAYEYLHLPAYLLQYAGVDSDLHRAP